MKPSPQARLRPRPRIPPRLAQIRLLDRIRHVGERIVGDTQRDIHLLTNDALVAAHASLDLVDQAAGALVEVSDPLVASDLRELVRCVGGGRGLVSGGGLKGGVSQGFW